MTQQNFLRYPLSASQRWVFDHCLAHPRSTQYNLPAITRLVPAVEVPRLIAAWQQLLAQRPVLHTRFALDAQGEPVQWSDPSLEVPVIQRHMTAAELEQYIANGFVRPFNLLSGEPLLRVEFITTEKETVMLTDLQHTIFDGITFNRLMWGRDLVRLYEGKKISPAEQGLYEGAETEQSVCGQEQLTEAEQREAEEYRQAREYCLKKFQGVKFTTLSRAPENTAGPLVRHREYLPREQCDTLCQQLGTDSASLFLAAFVTVLARRTGQQQAALCMKHHGRLRRSELKSYGMFVRFLPLLLTVDGNLLAACRKEMDTAAAYAAYPIAHLRQELGRAPRLIYNFLALKGMDTCLHLEGAAMPTVLIAGGETEDELSCNIYWWGDDYEIRVESGGGMNDFATVKAVAQEIRAVVLGMMTG